MHKKRKKEAREPIFTSNVGIGLKRPVGVGEPKLGVLDAALQGILVRQARIHRVRNQQPAERRNQVLDPLAKRSVVSLVT
jgi:hypothetical protein